MIEPGSNEVAIDQAHLDLLNGLVRASKPDRVLELGYGSGAATRAILNGLWFNQKPWDYTVVDSWLDWRGQAPPEVREGMLKPRFLEGVQFVTSDEESFVRAHRLTPNKWDFILSDADHHHAHMWATEVYNELLNDGGILAYHDVDGTYPGLAGLPKFFREAWGANVMVFDRSSRKDERCGRGLLVIRKNARSLS